MGVLWNMESRVEPSGAGALDHPTAACRQRNPHFLGPAPVDQVAAQIATAVGPSGPNWQYLYRLADAMRELRVQDEELFALEAKVRRGWQIGRAHV